MRPQVPAPRCTPMIDIMSLNELRALPGDTGDLIDVCAVYFLWRGADLLYIGQSACLENRVFAHERRRDGYHAGVQIPFDRYTFIQIGKEAIDATETAYIRTYRPPYNKSDRGVIKRSSGIRS
jgi:hypothetical protein